MEQTNSPSERFRQFYKKLVTDRTIYNQSDLARLLRVQKSYISTLLSGKKTLTKRFAESLTETFPELNQWWLLTGEGDMLLQPRTEEQEAITDRIAVIAKNEDISISAMEHLIGASKGVLSRAINNHTDIQSKWIQEIARAFPGYSARWLLTGDRQERPYKTKSDGPETVLELDIPNERPNILHEFIALLKLNEEDTAPFTTKIDNPETLPDFQTMLQLRRGDLFEYTIHIPEYKGRYRVEARVENRRFETATEDFPDTLRLWIYPIRIYPLGETGIAPISVRSNWFDENAQLADVFIVDDEGKTHREYSATFALSAIPQKGSKFRIEDFILDEIADCDKNAPKSIKAKYKKFEAARKRKSFNDAYAVDLNVLEVITPIRYGRPVIILGYDSL